MTPRLMLTAVLTCSLGVGVVDAAIIGFAIGSDSPPPVLGPHAMTEFGPDGRPEFLLVDDVPSPLGGAVQFSTSLVHLKSASSWATCSAHAHGGESVYFADDLTEVTLILPDNTVGFYFYTGPNGFVSAPFQAECGGVAFAQIAEPAEGGAVGFGFFTDDFTPLPPITITTDQEFMVGCHLGIAAAAPSDPCDSRAACPETDVNCDDVTDGFDIAVVRQSVNWLRRTGDADEPRADVNRDGVIDGFDIAVIRGGRCWRQ